MSRSRNIIEFAPWRVRDRNWHVTNVDKLTYTANVEFLSTVSEKQNYRFVLADVCRERFGSMGLKSTADTWLRMQANFDLAQIRAQATSIKVTRLVPKVA
jgi:dTDP-D-glucose 4,6-dehydratase